MPMHFLSIVLLLIRARVCDGANEIKNMESRFPIAKNYLKMAQ